MASEDGSMTDGLVDVVDREFRGTFVSMGNPHFVIFVDDIAEIDVEKYGKALEYDPLFPERCNIEFAEVLDDGNELAHKVEVFTTVKGNQFIYWRDEESDEDFITKVEQN